MPYLELTKNITDEEPETKEIEMPDVTGLTLKEAKAVLKELGLEYEINTEDLEAVIKTQVPKKGIKVNTGTKIILYNK